MLSAERHIYKHVSAALFLSVKLMEPLFSARRISGSRRVRARAALSRRVVAPAHGQGVSDITGVDRCLTSWLHTAAGRAESLYRSHRHNAARNVPTAWRRCQFNQEPSKFDELCRTAFGSAQSFWHLKESLSGSCRPCSFSWCLPPVHMCVLLPAFM